MSEKINNTITESDSDHTAAEMSRTVGGFRFDHPREAQLALREQHNIATLKSKIDFTKTQDMIALYKRLVEKRVFRTPIGYQFLGEFRDYLTQEAGFREEDVPYITVEPTTGPTYAQQEQMEFLQQENERLETKEKKYRIAIGIFLFLVLSMLLITAFNPNVGYINTENKILNRYSSWEEELTKREEEIRKREAELGIQPEPVTDQDSEAPSE